MFPLVLLPFDGLTVAAERERERETGRHRDRDREKGREMDSGTLAKWMFGVFFGLLV